MNSENNISKEIPQNPQKNPTSPQNKKKLGGGGGERKVQAEKKLKTPKQLINKNYPYTKRWLQYASIAYWLHTTY